MRDSIRQLLAAQRGIALAGPERAHRNRLDHLVRTGQLTRVLPGVYTVPELAADPVILARAFTTAHPDAIVTGKAAAALTFWPELTCARVEVVGRAPVRNPLFAVRRTHIPAELVDHVHGIPVTRPALTALELCTSDLGPDAVDRALLRSWVTLPELHRTLELLPHRPGNTLRRQLLRDTATFGCSVLERRAHRLLRSAGITEWVANRRFRIGGSTIVPDIRFTRLRLILEFDGYAYHHQRDVFETDRSRDNLVQIHRFIALRFTDRSLEDGKDFVRQVRAAMRIAHPA